MDLWQNEFLLSACKTMTGRHKCTWPHLWRQHGCINHRTAGSQCCAIPHCQQLSCTVLTPSTNYSLWCNYFSDVSRNIVSGDVAICVLLFSGFGFMHSKSGNSSCHSFMVNCTCSDPEADTAFTESSLKLAIYYEPTQPSSLEVN